MADKKHIVCPHCHSVNSLPSARLADAPKCGKCKQLLFLAKPVELTTTNFATHITRSDIPLVVDFWAPWCGPCKMMAPVFEQAASALEPRVRLAKVNTEVEQQLAAQYAIRSIPTLAVFKKGREVARQAGAMDAGSLRQWINAQLQE
jgi:thioredoxin 2